MARHDVRVCFPFKGECVDSSFADGSRTNVTGHQSNLMPSSYSPYSASGAVQAYIQKGVPASKIFMGVPVYSRGFSGTMGLGSTSTGPSPDMSWQAGVADYKALPEPGAVQMWDDVAQAGYSYDATRCERVTGTRWLGRRYSWNRRCRQGRSVNLGTDGTQRYHRQDIIRGFKAS